MIILKTTWPSKSLVVFIASHAWVLGGYYQATTLSYYLIIIFPLNNKKGG
jgi:hypothetical protein